jgi:hypothetical protein
MLRLLRLAVFLGVSTVLVVSLVSSRTTYNLDFDWKLESGSNPHPVNCSASTFPIDLDDKQCYELTQSPFVVDADGCRAVCCGEASCTVWQWCPGGDKDCTDSGVSGGNCWTGNPDINQCKDKKGWKSGGRAAAPTPAPAPNACNDPECKVSFDDSGWRDISVPHDFVVEGMFSETGDKSHGYLPYSKSWYRKHFKIDASNKDKHIYLDFDGVMVQSQVYLNGKLLGGHTSGYTPFRFTLNNTDLIFGGGDNVLAVFVDATKPDGWW